MMRKDVGLVLAAAICFDLGVVVVPVQAADVSLNFQKIDVLYPDHQYLKIKMTDVIVTSKACLADKGILVEFKGEKYCQTNKAAALPSTQKK